MTSRYYDYKEKKSYDCYDINDVAKRLSKETKLSLEKSKLVVKVIVEAMAEGLSEHKSLMLKGFGLFRIKVGETKYKKALPEMVDKWHEGKITKAELIKGSKEWGHADYLKVFFKSDKKLKKLIKDADIIIKE